MDIKTAAEITGTTDYRSVGQSINPITADERELAIQVAYEIANRHGLNLDAYIVGQEQSEHAYAALRRD